MEQHSAIQSWMTCYEEDQSIGRFQEILVLRYEMPHALRSNAWSDDFTNTSSDESYKREQSKQATGPKAKDVNRG